MLPSLCASAVYLWAGWWARLAGAPGPPGSICTEGSNLCRPPVCSWTGSFHPLAGGAASQGCGRQLGLTTMKEEEEEEIKTRRQRERVNRSKQFTHSKQHFFFIITMQRHLSKKQNHIIMQMLSHYNKWCVTPSFHLCFSLLSATAIYQMCFGETFVIICSNCWFTFLHEIWNLTVKQWFSECVKLNISCRHADGNYSVKTRVSSVPANVFVFIELLLMSLSLFIFLV